MTATVRPRWIIAGIIMLAATAYLLGYMNIYARYPADDAYIHMRIARNFVTHGVPYFNIDQPVAGSSSVFWLLLLSGLFAIFGPSVHAVLIVSTLGMFGVYITCTVVLVRRYNLIPALILSFLLTACIIIEIAASLMETPFAILFLLLSIIYIERKAYFLVGLYTALAITTRYEFIVWLALMLIFSQKISKGEQPERDIPLPRQSLLQGIKSMPVFRLMGGSFIPLSVMSVFNLYFFGSLIPNTIKAKLTVYTLNINETLFTGGLLPNITIFLIFLSFNILIVWSLLIRSNLTPHQELTKYPQPLNQHIPLQTKETPNLQIIGFIAAFGLIIIGIHAIQKTFIFPWYTPIYFFPLLLAYIVVIKESPRKTPIHLIAIILTLYLSFNPARTAFYKAEGLILNRPLPNIVGLHVQQYLNIGKDLAQTYPQATIMAAEIGGIGWTFPGKIIDAIGLVSPESLAYHPLRIPQDRASGMIGAIPPQVVQDLRPDIIVSMEIFSAAVRRDMANGSITAYVLLRNYPVISEQDSSFIGSSTLWDSRWTQAFVRSDGAISR